MLIKKFLFKPIREILEKRKAKADAEIGEAVKAREEAETMKLESVNEIKDEIGSMAMEIAGKVIEREVNATDHAKLIDEFINKVGDGA